MGSLDSHIHVDCFQSFDIFVALSVIFFAPTTAITDFWKLISYADFFHSNCPGIYTSIVHRSDEKVFNVFIFEP